jgi:dTDP-4-dehydrorhamnose 3,5-epimerase
MDVFGQIAALENSLLVTEFSISDSLVLAPREAHDRRGFFFEAFGARALAPRAGEVEFMKYLHPSAMQSRAIKRSLFQFLPVVQGKLADVPDKAAHDVAIDSRLRSSVFGHFQAASLSAASWPRLRDTMGFANGWHIWNAHTGVVCKLDARHNRRTKRRCARRGANITVSGTMAANNMLRSSKGRTCPRRREGQGRLDGFQPALVESGSAVERPIVQ